MGTSIAPPGIDANIQHIEGELLTRYLSIGKEDLAAIDFGLSIALCAGFLYNGCNYCYFVGTVGIMVDLEKGVECISIYTHMEKGY